MELGAELTGLSFGGVVLLVFGIVIRSFFNTAKEESARLAETEKKDAIRKKENDWIIKRQDEIKQEIKEIWQRIN